SSFYCLLRLPHTPTLFPYTTLFRSRPNLYNTLTADEERTQTEFTFERFAPHIQVNPWGLEFEFISVGSMRMVVAYRRDLNYALVDRKSTRLNSSHVSISYAVFCLKK